MGTPPAPRRPPGPNGPPGRLRRAIAAALTPLREGGEALDEAAFRPYVRFLAAGGLDGALVCGTTGEGILLRPDERRAALELFLEARPDGFAVAAHCGAQTTAETEALAGHAAAAGADAVAVIAPPYFRLDERELFAHFRAAAEACAPLPFYVYEFAARSGYAVPVAVVARLREACPNLAGLKVSDTPFEAVAPYLLEGLDVFVGSEPLALEGMRAGAVGTVSGLAAAWPELVRELVHGGSEEAAARVRELRERLARLPFHAALKAVARARRVPIREDVRRPLRGLEEAERPAVGALLEAGRPAGRPA
ncbi:MAG TPA: dihydrodipicolinate synthase family protein [Actinomycetota bacterium]|nr:dihydrodipicolinate synthase family protein [Actinomycetota bacterium]